MKKVIKECKIHGLTLHRCKRKYWHVQKEKTASDYTEKCFKCIAAGKYNKTSETKKESTHIRI